MGYNHCFFDDQLLYVTKDQQDNYNLSAYNLDTQSILEVFILGAHEAKENSGKLYYTKYYQPGLWLYQANGEIN